MWRKSVLENPIEEVDIGLVESMSNLFHLFKLRMMKMLVWDCIGDRIVFAGFFGLDLSNLLSAAWRGDMAWEVRAALFSFATAALKLKACELTKLTPLVSD